jgi:hypothetical protein
VKDTTICKKGWCNEQYDRTVALGAFMDQSESHNEVEFPKE